ncbi:HAD family hydrolase [Kushneria phosphatilytica]|uniref:HAD-IA family hydrolase n=1 Tax=Kushneria phosphatilytica TaxID=657387 RepID=A0A1S1NWJ0_9GAMM|nr:HAD-IA family hydrolase [Kushneria phosphatilytica]OHV11797.1 HAD family hydrolase [Kushneria phosphatilytica]QEL10962.1 HAD-IA family hydrolase [Kushneria phosphatilytica]
MRYRLIILDWDGTLMDSAPRIVDCMQRAAVDIGWAPLSAEAVRDIIGLGLPEAIARLCPGITTAQADNLRRCYSERFVAAETRGVPMPFFEGIESGIAQLREWPEQQLAVATGKSRRGLDRILESTGSAAWFDATRTADMTRSKPDPLMLRELLDELHVPVEEAVMIGDSEYDLSMAKQLGMARIGVSWGVHDRARLEAHAPLWMADDPATMFDWLCQ